MILTTPFPDIPSIGRLDVLDVFAYHDGPRLFTARSIIGNLFLVEWAAENDAGDIWLIVPLSPMRYRALAAGEISFRSIFTDSELGFVYEAHVPRSHAQITISELRSTTIPDTLLPAKDERVDEEEARILSTSAHFVGIGRAMIDVPSLDLRIQPITSWNIISIRDLADLFVQFQRFSDAVFRMIQAANHVIGPRPRLGVAQAYSGSLGLIISTVGAESQNSAGPTTANLLQIASLINAAMTNRDELRLSPEALPRMSQVLNWFAVKQVEATLSVIAVPEWSGFLTRITPGQSREAVEFLRQRGATEPPNFLPRLALLPESPQTSLLLGSGGVKGKFSSLDTVHMTYEFQDNRGATYRGIVAETAMEAARHITFGLDYMVWTEPDIDATGSVSWRLLEIRPTSQ